MRKIQERLRKAQEAMRQQQLEKEGKTGEGSKTTDENQENNPPPLQFFYQPITLEQLINMVVSYPLITHTIFSPIIAITDHEIPILYICLAKHGRVPDI